MWLDDLISSPLERSLRVKVTLSVVLPLVLILGSFTAIEYRRHRQASLANLSILASQTSQVIENSVLHQMLSRNLTGLQYTLDAIGEGEMIRVVYLLDSTGRVVFAPQETDVGVQLDNSDPTCQACHRLPAAERPSSVVVTLAGGQRVFRSMNPIENRVACHDCHDADERLLGLLLTDISIAPLEGPLAAELQENLRWWIATVLATVLVVNVALSRFVLRRLERLATANADLRRVQLPRPLPENRSDEIGQLGRAFNALVRQLKTREAENARLSASLRQESAQRGELLKRLITAQEDERKRVARELHDDLGQHLTGLTLRADVLERFLGTDPERAHEQVSEIRALSTQATDRMYDLILDLRPSALDDLGLVAALQAHADRTLHGTGVTYQLETQAMNGRLPAELETALYRIHQEALSNIVRHAQARHVDIRMARSNGVFEGEIIDDGRGFDPEGLQLDGQNPRGLGLLGMRERVTQCGGRLDIISRPGEGTRLHIRVPVATRDYE